MLQKGDLVEILQGPGGVVRKEEYEGQIGTIVKVADSRDGSAFIRAPRRSSKIEDIWWYGKHSFRQVQMPSYDCDDSGILSFLEDF